MARSQNEAVHTFEVGRALAGAVLILMLAAVYYLVGALAAQMLDDGGGSFAHLCGALLLRSMSFIGLAQAVYVVPLAWTAKRRNRTPEFAGILLGAIAVLILDVVALSAHPSP